jgi:hypothetical protein
MNKDPYVTFVNAKGNAINVVIAWVGSILGPLFIISEFGNYYEWSFYIGIGLTLTVLLSIWHGFKALKRNIYSDFFAYALMPILIPIISVVLLVVSSDV